MLPKNLKQIQTFDSEEKNLNSDILSDSIKKSKKLKIQERFMKLSEKFSQIGVKSFLINSRMQT